MKNNQSLEYLMEIQKEKKGTLYSYSSGVTKRLLEKYKPIEEVETIHNKKTVKTKRAA